MKLPANHKNKKYRTNFHRYATAKKLKYRAPLNWSLTQNYKTQVFTTLPRSKKTLPRSKKTMPQIPRKFNSIDILSSLGTHQGADTVRKTNVNN